MRASRGLQGVQASVQAGTTAAGAGYLVDENQIVWTTGLAQGIELEVQLDVLIAGAHPRLAHQCSHFHGPCGNATRCVLVVHRSEFPRMTVETRKLIANQVGDAGAVS